MNPPILSTRRTFLAVGTIFIFALAIRLVYLWESLDCPTAFAPILDSDTYDELARNFEEGKGVGAGFFWQPFFYPFFLSVVYSLTDSSILVARIAQMVIGALTCVTTFFVGRRIFPGRAGMLAAIFISLYGTQVFFDGELLATGWASFWSAVLILVFLEAEALDLSSKRTRATVWLLGVGLCGGLSVLTRPTFLPFLVVTALIYLPVRYRRGGARIGPIACAVLLMIAGYFLIVAPVAVIGKQATGQLRFLPESGALNVYLGNNPDADKSLLIRPGWDWDQLTGEPGRYAATVEHDAPEYFRTLVLEYVRNEPVRFATGLADKTVQFLAPREIPRNVDVYLYHRWSVVLRILVWKVGSFGFPFGVIFPLALIGGIELRRRLPVPIWLFLVLYPGSVILVFVSARYRAPVIPVLSVLAAAGCLAVVRVVAQRRWHRLLLYALLSAATIFVTALPGPYGPETVNYEAEMNYYLGGRHLKTSEASAAIPYFARAVELDPDHNSAHNSLGIALFRTGRLDDAIHHFREAVRIENEHGSAHANLALALSRKGLLTEAVHHGREALRIVPDQPEVLNELGISLARLGRLDEALLCFRDAVRLKPGDPFIWNNLGAATRESGRTPESVEYFRQALELDPDYAEARANLEQALQHLERRSP